MKLVECSPKAEFDSTHDGKKKFRNLDNFAEILHFGHNLALSSCMKFVECTMELGFYSTHDGEKKIRKLQFSGRIAEFLKFGQIFRNFSIFSIA